jgi:hypothetical protein
MAKATVRPNARTASKTNRDAAIIERVNRRYNQPGLYKKGLEILAKAADPIFDLIEAHRTAWARIVDAQKNLQSALSKDAFTVEIEARGREVDDAWDKLLKTPPATPGGARAIIEYLIEWDKESDPETSYKYLSTLLLSPIFAEEEGARMNALAAEFEAANQAERAFYQGGGTDAESNAAILATREVVQKIAALPGKDISVMRLKARAYMQLEGAEDLDEFDDVQHDMVSGPVLVSLFRDLFADHPSSVTGEEARA